MIVYSIFDEHGTTYYRTLKQARAAFTTYYVKGEGAEIEKIWLVDLPPHALAVQLLNAESFVVHREVVA